MKLKPVVGVCTIVIALGAVSGCIANKQSYVAKGNKLFAAGKYEDASPGTDAALGADRFDFRDRLRRQILSVHFMDGR